MYSLCTHFVKTPREAINAPCQEDSFCLHFWARYPLILLCALSFFSCFVRGHYKRRLWNFWCEAAKQHWFFTTNPWIPIRGCFNRLFNYALRHISLPLWSKKSLREPTNLWPRFCCFVVANAKKSLEIPPKRLKWNPVWRCLCDNNNKWTSAKLMLSKNVFIWREMKVFLPLTRLARLGFLSYIITPHQKDTLSHFNSPYLHISCARDGGWKVLPRSSLSPFLLLPSSKR